MILLESIRHTVNVDVALCTEIMLRSFKSPASKILFTFYQYSAHYAAEWSLLVLLYILVDYNYV